MVVVTHLDVGPAAEALVLVAEAGGRSNDFLRGEGLLHGNPYLVACPGVYEQVAEMIGPMLNSD